MNRFSILLIALFLLSGTVAADASAQSREGFFIGLDLGGLGVSSAEDDEAGSGFGGGFDIGYGFSERFALVLGAHGAEVDNDVTDDGTATAAAGYLAGRVNFGKREGALNGFVQLGGGAGSYEGDVLDTNVTFEGPAGLFGAGVTYFVSPNWMLMGSLDFYGIEFEEVSVGGLSADISFDGNYAFFGVGIRYMIR
ncbi:MAG: outer membrane beta-barrel protein [Rhodothermales bacterium]|nr:outer membrane beta-barrel protein [Rhodothermales bacterium]